MGSISKLIHINFLNKVPQNTKSDELGNLSSIPMHILTKTNLVIDLEKKVNPNLYQLLNCNFNKKFKSYYLVSLEEIRLCYDKFR